jgi:hypothetical protein
MRKEKGPTSCGVALTVAMGVVWVLVSLPAGAEECQRNGHAVSEDALCCNMKRVQRCAGAHGWADYPTEVCDRGESAAEVPGTEPRASSASPTASAPAAERLTSGCFDCDGTVRGTGQTARNAGHEQICQNNGKWQTIDLLKK